MHLFPDYLPLLRGMIVSVGLVLVSCSGGRQTEAAEVAEAAPLGGDSSLEGRIFESINSYRARQSKVELRRHAGLDKLARHHSRQMLRDGELSHKGYHHRLGMADYYLEIEDLRENVFYARGVATESLPERTVQGWIDSKAHRMNLLANTRFCGIGVARDGEGRFYATQLVGKPSDARSFYRPGMPKSYSNMFGVGTGGVDW